MRQRTDPKTATSNRTAFRRLLTQHRITMKVAADMIAEATSRPCAYRTVKSWLASPGSISSRPCPDWALKTLIAAIERIKPKSR